MVALDEDERHKSSTSSRIFLARVLGSDCSVANEVVEKIKDRRVEENKIITEIVARDIERLCRPKDSD